MWQRLAAISHPATPVYAERAVFDDHLEVGNTPHISNSKFYGAPMNSFMTDQKRAFEHHARRDEGVWPVCWSSKRVGSG